MPLVRVCDNLTSNVFKPYLMSYDFIIFQCFVGNVVFTYESEALRSDQQVLSIARVQLSIQRLWVIPYDI